MKRASLSARAWGAAERREAVRLAALAAQGSPAALDALGRPLVAVDQSGGRP